MEVQVGDIVEVSVWNGGLVDKGEVLEIYSKASPHVEDQFLVQSQGVSNGLEID